MTRGTSSNQCAIITERILNRVRIEFRLGILDQGRYPDRRDGRAVPLESKIRNKSILIIIIVVVIASSFLSDKGYIEPETTTWKMRLSTYR